MTKVVRMSISTYLKEVLTKAQKEEFDRLLSNTNADSTTKITLMSNCMEEGRSHINFDCVIENDMDKSVEILAILEKYGLDEMFQYVGTMNILVDEHRVKVLIRQFGGVLVLTHAPSEIENSTMDVDFLLQTLKQAFNMFDVKETVI